MTARTTWRRGGLAVLVGAGAAACGAVWSDDATGPPGTAAVAIAVATAPPTTEPPLYADDVAATLDNHGVPSGSFLAPDGRWAPETPSTRWTFNEDGWIASASVYVGETDAGELFVSVYVVDTDRHAVATAPRLARKAEGAAAVDDRLRGRSQRCGRILVAVVVHLKTPSRDEARTAQFLSDTIETAGQILDASYGPC